MTKQYIITWVLLMILTISAGLVSMLSLSYVIPIILILAAFKFIGVAFNLMEMNKANLFWKILIISFLLVFCGIIIIVI